MIFPKVRQILAACLIGLVLFVSACAPEEPSRWDQAQQDSTQVTRDQRSATQPVAGSAFNKFFPAGGNGFERVYTQEKQGFAEAKLKRGGQDVAMLSISDTATNPSAAQKYQQSTKRIGGYPAVDQGANGTAVLVANRFQVKVQSRDASFSQSDREAWLQKFDLNGLSRLQ